MTDAYIEQKTKDFSKADIFRAYMDFVDTIGGQDSDCLTDTLNLIEMNKDSRKAQEMLTEQMINSIEI